MLSGPRVRQRSVTGVEINGDIIGLTNDTYGEYTGQLDEQPGVRIVNDDARSYLERTDDDYGLIQISLIDTWAATSAGAFALPRTACTPPRPGTRSSTASTTTASCRSPGTSRTPRSTATRSIRWRPTGPSSLASQALTERGVDEPRDHVLVYAAPSRLPGGGAGQRPGEPGAVLRRRRRHPRARAEELGFEVKLDPTTATDPVIEALSRPGPGPALDMVSADISPPTDDRPFFFQMADFGTFFDKGILRDHFVIRPVLVLAGLGRDRPRPSPATCIALPLLVGPPAGDRSAGAGRAALLHVLRRDRPRLPPGRDRPAATP